MRAYSKRYYKKNRLRLLQQTKEYALSHPEVRKKVSRNYRQNHPDRYRAQNKAAGARRKARLRGADVADSKINAVIREWRLRPTFRCFYCQKIFSTRRLQVDHVLPISKGGKHSVSNICKCCSHCNPSKGAKPVNGLCVNGQRLLI